MSSLYKDSRLYFILGANSLSAIGSGIVMITIPWLLIKESGGETTFGYVSIISTLIMFLLTPFIGQSIDRFSRKSLLLCNEGIWTSDFSCDWKCGDKSGEKCIDDGGNPKRSNGTC